MLNGNFKIKILVVLLALFLTSISANAGFASNNRAATPEQKPKRKLREAQRGLT